MKKLYLIRIKETEEQTTGVLLVMQGEEIIYKCLTLELPWRNNAKGMSCVPAGKYPIVFEWSPRFKQNLWELKNVPGRSEAKVHTANFVHQLNGCVAPGKNFIDINGDGIVDVTNSARTLSELHHALRDITQTTITIHGEH